MAGSLLQVDMIAKCNYGFMAMVSHSRVEKDLGENRKLVAWSGLGPEEPTSDVFESGIYCGLATRFELFEGDEVAAHCHLSYRDGSNDQSMGPTIEILEVHPKHHGKNLLPLLWHWVKEFIMDSFTLECLNNDAPMGHIMVKATYLTNSVVDRRGDEDITDKEFLYNYAGFSVREQKRLMGAMMKGRRPSDEEAVLYIKLPTKAQLERKSEELREGTRTTAVDWVHNPGSRSCTTCERIGPNLLRCSRCRDVFYCDKNCQKRDWKAKYKLWCSKTKEEVLEILIERGDILIGDDGQHMVNV